MDMNMNRQTDIPPHAAPGARYFDDQPPASPQWLPLFISLMLVLLTLFIFLTTYAESDVEKVRIFKEHFRKSLVMQGEGGMGAVSITDAGTAADTPQPLIRRMKSSGIDKKRMDEFLTLNQVKALEVREGKQGLAVIIPDAAAFEPGKNRLTENAVKTLAALSPLVAELPYLVEIKGFAAGAPPQGYGDLLEFSASRALLVYDYFINRDIAPVKLKVSARGSAAPQDKVEIIFKSPEL
jgi:flagellar motor protein MotB